MPTTPRVSVVVPTHNRHAEVHRAVTSVLAQTVADIEVIVVDDGSSLPVTFAGAVGEDPRVQIVRHDSARGVSAARNAAIDAARGEWVAFLDDDDFWAPDKLELQLRAAAECDATLVYSAVVYVAADGEVLNRSVVTPADGLTRRLLLWNAIGGPSTVVVARDDLHRVGRFDPDLDVLADWDMWIRLSEVCEGVAVPETTTAILVHPGNMQTTQVAQIDAELSVMEHRYAYLLAGSSTRFGSAGTNAWLAHRRWQAERSVRNLIAYAYWWFRNPSPTRYQNFVAAVSRRLLPAKPPPNWVAQHFTD